MPGKDKSEEKNTVTQFAEQDAAAQLVEQNATVPPAERNAAVPPVKEATKFYIDELTAASKEVFGVQPEVIITALNFKYQGKQDMFTKAEVRAAIESFRKKEVTQHGYRLYGRMGSA
jgi:hypothetical protein